MSLWRNFISSFSGGWKSAFVFLCIFHRNFSYFIKKAAKSEWLRIFLRNFGKNGKSSSFDELLERMKGVEPSSRAWEACVLPMNYTRKVHIILALFLLKRKGKEG